MLKEGVLVTAAGAFLFMIYAAAGTVIGRKKKNKRACRTIYHIKQKTNTRRIT
jgi:hypothetical protein